jgi:hypothetical protein
MRLDNDEEPADVKQLAEDSAADMEAVRSVLEGHDSKTRRIGTDTTKAQEASPQRRG